MKRSMQDAQDATLYQFSRNCKSGATGTTAVEIGIRLGKTKPTIIEEAPQFSMANAEYFANSLKK